MDTVLVPISETPERWIVETHPGPTRLGVVDRKAAGLWLTPEPGSLLEAAERGPHASREAVQSAIEACLGGACELFKFEKPAPLDPGQEGPGPAGS